MFLALFIGNLAADATINQGNSSRYCSFRAASNKNSVNKATGQVTTYTTWVTVNINAGYENIMPFLKKGVKVFVMGYESHNIYQDKAGMSQVGITISAMRIELCGEPRQQMPGQQPTMQQPVQQPVQQPEQQPVQGQRPVPGQQAYQQQQTYHQQPPYPQQPPQGGYNPSPGELEFARQWGSNELPF